MRRKHLLIMASRYEPLAYQLLQVDDNPSYIPDETKNFLIMEADSTCQICKRKTDKPHIDHIKPVCMGGKAHLDNLQVLCQFCNLSKSGHGLDPKSYKVGYVIPIYIKSDYALNKTIMERVLDENY